MKAVEAISREAMLHELPSIDELLRSATGVSLLPLAGPMYLTVLARGAVDEMRNQILAGDEDTADVLERCESRLAELWQRSQRDLVCRLLLEKKKNMGMP